ncbi:DUF6090 family protein [Winogradskyella vincentii]|uniref:Uncharacterized protein n=1 Tax=Winogradskyella vincentii TaxID=2877122 RepID=A0ABS7Y3M4_9FLAO|nr:DUF6090 family protein [Winogradskyella vincentii]MCA0154519.1 hypothetical protein [Winogradskyella vincentii]
MIKFFRKIRQKLLTENKLSKYLLYAIGEIILVVIGILIALTINNWNTKNKDKAKEVVFLNKITNNLNEDLLLYKGLIRSDSITIVQMRTLRNALKNKNENDFSKITNNIISLMTGREFTVNKTAFENIVSSGQIDILKNDSIVDNLFLYYRQVEVIKRGPDMGATEYNRNVFGPLLINFGSPDHTIKDLPMYQKNLALNNSVDWKIFLLNNKIREYKSQVEFANEIIDLIFKETNE